MNQPRINGVPSGAARAVDAAQVTQRRTEAGMTQAALASAAGVTRPYITLIESGRRTRVAPHVIDAIASALGCQTREITASSDDSEQWHTTTEAAEILRLHPTTLREQIRRGEIRAARIGRRYRVSSREIRRLLGDPISA